MRSRAALEFDATYSRKRDVSGSTSARSCQALPPLSILNSQFSVPQNPLSLCPSVLKKRYALCVSHSRAALEFDATGLRKRDVSGSTSARSSQALPPLSILNRQFSILCPSKSSVPLSLCFEKTLRVTRSRAALEFDATGLRKQDVSGSTSARSCQVLPPLSILNRQFSILCPSVPLF